LRRLSVPFLLPGNRDYTLLSREVLNDAEVQKFYQLYEEIERRALAVTAA